MVADGPRLLLDLAAKASLLIELALRRGDKRLSAFHDPFREGHLALVPATAHKAQLDPSGRFSIGDGTNLHLKPLRFMQILRYFYAHIA